jgi:hypothetical protein
VGKRIALTALMYDGIDALAAGIARQFPDVTKIAGYINGRYAWSQAEWNLFPHADHVTISITAAANAGDVLDVEVGDASPDQTAGWIAMRKAAGLYRPTIYCSRSVIPAVRAGTGSYILGRDYDIWVADYTGSPHQVAAPGTPSALCAATQYESTANWDASMVYDPAWPHRKPPAPGMLPPPSFISATLHGRSVNLGWGEVDGARDYEVEVYHHNSSGIYGSIVFHQAVKGLNVEGLALPGGGQYQFRVRAHEPAGAWSPYRVF